MVPNTISWIVQAVSRCSRSHSLIRSSACHRPTAPSSSTSASAATAKPMIPKSSGLRSRARMKTEIRPMKRISHCIVTAMTALR